MKKNDLYGAEKYSKKLKYYLNSYNGGTVPPLVSKSFDNINNSLKLYKLVIDKMLKIIETFPNTENIHKELHDIQDILNDRLR